MNVIDERDGSDAEQFDVRRSTFDANPLSPKPDAEPVFHRTSNIEHRTSTPREQQLQEILELSQGLVSMARQGDWDQVADLERSRRSQMLRYFERSVSAEESLMVEKAIRQIAEYDHCLNNLVIEARDKVSAELHRMRAGQQAVKAYRE